MKNTVTYPTIVRHLREIALLGTADLAYWREQLRAHQLVPYNANGRAQILISATALKWNNISARECILAVMVGRSADESAYGGSFLLHAFNSRRLFALAERKVFASPYSFAAIDFDTGPPRFRVRLRGDTVITARRKNNAPAPSVQEIWEYPIVLPPLNGKPNAPQKFFFAKLSGATQIFPVAVEDELLLQTSAHAPVFQNYHESGFTPTEWRIRTDATHCKSNTFTVGKDAVSPFAHLDTK